MAHHVFLYKQTKWKYNDQITGTDTIITSNWSQTLPLIYHFINMWHVFISSSKIIFHGQGPSQQVSLLANRASLHALFLGP